MLGKGGNSGKETGRLSLTTHEKPMTIDQCKKLYEHYINLKHRVALGEYNLYECWKDGGTIDPEQLDLKTFNIAMAQIEKALVDLECQFNNARKENHENP